MNNWKKFNLKFVAPIPPIRISILKVFFIYLHEIILKLTSRNKKSNYELYLVAFSSSFKLNTFKVSQDFVHTLVGAYLCQYDKPLQTNGLDCCPIYF